MRFLAGLVVLAAPAFRFLERFLGLAVQRVASNHPIAKPGHPERGHEQGDAHPEPSRNPFAEQIKHGSIIYEQPLSIGLAV